MQEDKFKELQEALLQAKEDFLNKERQRVQKGSLLKEESTLSPRTLTPEEELTVQERVSAKMEAQMYQEGYLKSESQIRCEVVADVLKERER